VLPIFVVALALTRRQEMRNWVNSDLEASIPILEFLGNHSISGLCESIARQTRLATKKRVAEGEEEPLGD